MKKVAVILMNLGGPTDLQAVRPFLFNLFYDKAILRVPNPLRWLLARLISWRRTPEATEIYEKLGGKSPLLEETQKQAQALEKVLNKKKGVQFKVIIAMRYWKPFSSEAVQQLLDFGADEVVLLPLYPQFSTTTNASSLKEFQKLLKNQNWTGKTHYTPCFFSMEEYLDVMAEKVKEFLPKAKKHGAPRILWTAHGLPKKIVEAGDPYQEHVEKTVSLLEERLRGEKFESVTCYQSRVGPLEWIGPYTDNEIERAGKEKVPLIIVPIAFVSEHSETLVELDMEYKELADQSGVPFYGRVFTVRDDPRFIEGLGRLVQEYLRPPKPFCQYCFDQGLGPCATRL